MKSIACAIASLGMLVSLSLPALAAPVGLQRSSPLSRSLLPIHYPPRSHPTLWSQANQPADLALLAKVIKLFLTSDTYQTESNIQVSSVSGNTTVQSSVQVTTISQFPNKFRSEIIFAKPGEKTSLTTLVISDGQQVWIYRPDLKQYQTVKYGSFSDHPDNYWLGFSNTIYSEIPPDARRYITQDDLSSANILQAVGLELNGLKGKVQPLGSQSLYLYEYKDAKEGFTFSALVEPQTAMLKQLQISGKSDGTDIVVIEQILRRIANPQIAPNTFRFSPPTGAKRVQSVPMGPF